MQTRLERAVEILNRKNKWGYRYVINDPTGRVALVYENNECIGTITLQEAINQAVQLEAGSGVKFGRDVDEC